MKRNLASVTTIVCFNLIFIFSSKTQGQQVTTIDQLRDSVIINHFGNFKNMHIGYYGSTQNCEPYQVYALKYRKNWFLIVSAKGNISYMHVNPPIKEKKIHYPSKYFIEGIALSFSHGYTKLKKRKRNVIDMDIYGYYKFNRYGKKIMKGLLYLEYPYYDKGIFKWKLDEEKAKKMLEEKAAEQLEVPKIESIKPEIIENIPVEKK